MSFSQHKVALNSRLRDVHIVRGGDRLVSEKKNREREQQSFQRGFEAGQKSVNEQLLQQRSELHQVYAGTLQSMQRIMPDLIAESEEALLALVTECVGRVLGGIEITPEIIQAVVREALSTVEAASVYSVQLHPADLQMLERNVSQHESEFSKVKFETDPKLTRGGCVLNTAFGVIDATLPSKLARLKGALRP